MRSHPSRELLLRGTGDGRLAAGIGLSLAFGVLLATAVLLGALRAHLDATAGAAVMTVVLALLVWWLHPLDALAAAGLAWLSTNGLVVDRYAQLRWHGAVDLLRLGLFFAVTLGVSVVRAGLLAVRKTPRAPNAGFAETLSAVPTPGDRHG